MSKTYPLLEKAPPHLSPAFIDYLRKNNKVVYENYTFLVIENCKYNTKKKPYLTAFKKGGNRMSNEQVHKDLESLLKKYANWQWLKKRTTDQTVKRFHIHLIK